MSVAHDSSGHAGRETALPLDTAFPFDAVVGMDDAKLALQLAALDPLIGGVLLRGQKGSAKTTLARGLAALMPSGSFVELPLSATEDRVVGSLDLGRALATSEVAFRPGLLARAHGGVLYVDEINLLADHLVDLLLDVAASGTNRVEREGVSHHHPARFVLVASMNPEEGELRPQLLDRFGLSVEVRAAGDRDSRVAAVQRRLAHDGARVAPLGGDAGRGTAIDLTGAGAAASGGSPDDLARRLVEARPALIGRELIESAASLALAAGVEGLRADLVLCRSAAALAGLEGRSVAGDGELRRVAPLVLGHRGRTGPFDQAVVPPGEIQALADTVLGPAPTDLDQASSPGSDRGSDPGSGSDPTAGSDRGDHGAPGPPDDDRGDRPGSSGRRVMELGGERPVVVPPRTERSPMRRGANGRGAGGSAGGGDLIEASRGRLVRDVPAEAGSRRSVAVVATVRHVAEQRGVGRDQVEPPIREAVRVAPAGRLVVLTVDTSGSMGAGQRARAATGAALGLLTDSYQRRDRVALVTFGGGGAEVALGPTGSVEIARHRLGELSTGGATPLADGVLAGLSVARGERDPGRRPFLVVLTDGRATGDPDALDRALAAGARVAAAGIDGLVLDCEAGAGPRLGLAARLAEAMGAACLAPATMEADHLVSLIRRTTDNGGTRP